MRKFGKKTVVMLMISSILLSGCGKKKETEQSIIDDFNNIQPSEVDNQPASMTQQEGEKLQYEIVGNNGGAKITVDADVVSDGVLNAKVYTLKKVEIDDAYLIALAEKIFDDGVYEIKPPLECCSRGELSDEQKLIDDMYNAEERKERIFYSDNYSTLETKKAIEEYDPQQERNLANGQVICAIDDMYNYREIGRIWGKIDHTNFELYYYNDQESEILEVHRIGHEPSKNGYKIMREVEDETSDQKANECNYEIAKEDAEVLLQNIGLDDYVLAASYNTEGCLVDPEIDQTFYTDGYRFEYVPSILDVPNAYTYRARVTSEYDPKLEAKEYANQPNVQIDIDSSGLLKIRFGCLYNVESELSENTVIMPFAKADEMAKNSFENVLGDTCTVNKIVFENVVVKYDNNYTSIPAWVYYIETNSSEVVALVAVNALDGSVVYFDVAYNQNLWFNRLDEIYAEDLLNK